MKILSLRAARGLQQPQLGDDRIHPTLELAPRVVLLEVRREVRQVDRRGVLVGRDPSRIRHFSAKAQG